MASTVKHLRSSTANKRPTASGLADGQLAINTASGTPGLFLKDSAGAVVKVGPVHVGAAAPNATPAGSSGNSKGELWINDTTTIHGLNYYTGSAFVNLTPSGTTTTAGLVELATDAETQTGTDTVRAVTPSGLQSKVSDSTSTTSSTTIASSTAVKAAFDLANAALPRSGGRVTGNLEIGPAGSLSFEGSTDDSFETFLAVVDPTADRTITLPNVTGTVITTGDTGTVTSTMITDGTIVNADINASAGIVDTKLATISTAGKVSNSATTAVSANTVNAIVTRDGSGNFSAGTITANLTGTASAIADNTVTSAKIVDGTIVNADINASAAIAGTKISPNFGSQTITTTGVISSALGTAAAPSIAFTGDTNTGIFSPGADQVAVATNGTGRLFVDASGRIGIGTTSPAQTLDIAGLAGLQLRGSIYTNFSDYWGSVDNRAMFLPYGFLGSNGSFALSLYANGYRNSSSGFTYMGINGNTSTAAGLDLQPDGNIIFRNGTAAGTILPERLRIDSAGRVGIGTTSPGNKLVVAEAGTGVTAVSEILAGTTGNASSSNISRLLFSTVGAGGGTGSANLSHLIDSGQFVFRSETTGGHQWYVGGSERARIDSSGRLLVGTSTAFHNSRFEVAGNAAVGAGGDNGFSTALVMSKTRGATVNSQTVVQNGDELGSLIFRGSDGTAYRDGAFITARVDGTPGTNDMPGRLVFSTTADGASSPTVRMTITSGGASLFAKTVEDNTTVGTVIDRFGLVSIVRDGNLPLLLNRLSSNGVIADFRRSSTTVGSISVTTTNTAYNTSSDYRLKENVAPVTDGITRLQQLKPSRFNFIADPDSVVDGFIAHEAAEVVPECVTGTKDEVDENGNPVYQGIDQSKIVPLLTAALQEAIAKIETLEQRLAAAGID